MGFRTLFVQSSFAALAVCLSTCLPGVAQEQSVNPGINQSFENPNVGEFVERFEREGREVYDRREQIVDSLGIKSGMRIGDVGAGTGLFTRMFAEKVGDQGRVYAVDISRNFVNNINQTSREKGYSNIVGVLCTKDSVELPEDAVDLVFICDTYHHFEFPIKTMKSIRDALKPHGKLCVIDFKRIEGVSSEWTLGHVRAGQEVFTKEIESSGFRLVGQKDFLNENYILEFEIAENAE